MISLFPECFQVYALSQLRLVQRTLERCGEFRPQVGVFFIQMIHPGICQLRQPNAKAPVYGMFNQLFKFFRR